jgi:hypothetical protein
MIMMKHPAIVAVAFLCMGIASARAQTTGSVTGRVVDEQGQPVSYATVRVEGTKLGAYTRADGFFVITGIPAGEYGVKAMAVGYRPLTREKVRITVGGGTFVQFALVLLTEKGRGNVRIPESGMPKSGPGSRATIDLGSFPLPRPLRRERTSETSIRVEGLTIDTVATDSTGLRREP